MGTCYRAEDFLAQPLRPVPFVQKSGEQDLVDDVAVAVNSVEEGSPGAAALDQTSVDKIRERFGGALGFYAGGSSKRSSGDHAFVGCKVPEKP